MLVGLLSIFYYKQGAESYAEFQKGWGLERRTAILVGRLIGIVGGLLFVGFGLLIMVKTQLPSPQGQEGGLAPARRHSQTVWSNSQLSEWCVSGTGGGKPTFPT